MEEQLFIDRDHHAPDFFVTKYGKSVAIEAVTVGRRADNPPSYFKNMKDPFEHVEIDADRATMSIRFDSPIHTKLQKKYWDLDHVKGHSFLIAIADFHDDQSMLWSSAALLEYLYGVTHDLRRDKDG